MRLEITGTSVALSATGFASNVTGATWTLAATTVSDGLAHKVTIHNDAATDHSAKTALITGTGPGGEAQTETLALPAGTLTTTSTKYFKSVTSVVPSASIGADTMDIGYNADCVSPWLKLKADNFSFNVGFGCTISGSPTYGVQHTYDNGASVFNHATVTGKNANFEGTYTTPVQAIRLNWTAAGGVTLSGHQVTSKG